ncbi:fasciclin domain-containing protein [Rubrivirga sp.]|uniref:fasciclin domain-containing protein n=1 Tax=Rubrivirga sp. TaxID=1885344 RepID=UPI003C77A267
MRLRTLLLALVALPLAASAQHRGDIVEVASGSDDFRTLVAAVQAAGLVETLQGDGPFTVFAPTNAAFARLGDDAIQSLLRPENRDQLTAILTYHVVPGRVTARQIGRIDELETVNGQSLSIGVRIDGAELVATDIEASNGIVHVIDRVLMPREMPAPSSQRRSSHH